MPHSFIAKSHNLQITLEPQTQIHTATGSSWTQGKRAQFTNGRFVADAKTAKDIGYATADELAAALREAGSFNSEFWEFGNEPGAQRPTVDEMLGAIADAAVDGNQKRLRELVASEQETHNREVVLNAAQRALGRLGDTELGKRGPGRPPQRKEPAQAA